MMRKSSCGNDRDQKLKERVCNGGAGGSSVGRVSDDAELLSTWFPRHYTCSFCKRRFKSAQALGGHMNVHRRARALLRSQSISPISSSSTSPWHPTNISTVHHPQQHDETSCFILANPNLNCSLQTTPHLTRSPSFPCRLMSHHPMISIMSPSTSLRHVNPLSPATSGYKHATGSGQYHHGVIRAKKNNNCIVVEDTHQDQAFVTLSLGNGLIISNSANHQDIDLELHL